MELQLNKQMVFWLIGCQYFNYVNSARYYVFNISRFEQMG